MTAPPEQIVRKVRAWVARADEDLRVARHILTLPDECPYRVAAYHAQQCAEKYLKAYLVFCRVDFPFTHNIARLLELCSERLGWGESLKDAEELTPSPLQPVTLARTNRSARRKHAERRTSPPACARPCARLSTKTALL
jgi:HEPN domain-containing protein